MGVRQSQIRKKKRKPQIQNLCEKWENKLFEQKKKSFGKTSTVDLWRESGEREERQITIERFYFPE